MPNKKKHTVICPDCKQQRDIFASDYRRIQKGIWDGVCRSCAGRRGRVNNGCSPTGSKTKAVTYKCPGGCGMIKSVSEYNLKRYGKTRCPACAVEFRAKMLKGVRPNKVTIRSKNFNASAPHPVRANAQPGSKSIHRCHGLWENCHHYDDCLNYVASKRWNGWVCSEQSDATYCETITSELIRTLYLDSIEEDVGECDHAIAFRGGMAKRRAK